MKFAMKSAETSLSIRLARLAFGLVPFAAACTPVFPPIADVGHDSVFKAAIALRHGPGTRGATLRSELAVEGFVLEASEIPGFRYSAVAAAQNPPCMSYVRLDWNEDRRGRVALIQATRLPCR